MQVGSGSAPLTQMTADATLLIEADAAAFDQACTQPLTCASQSGLGGWKRQSLAGGIIGLTKAL